MQTTFHIKKLYGTSYCASASFVHNGVTKRIETKFKIESSDVKKIVSRARTNISGTLYLMRKEDQTLPKKNRYDWDGDVRDLCFEQPVTTHTNIQKEAEQQKRLLEVKKVNNVWTIIKHESELLTWEDACALLKQRIENV